MRLRSCGHESCEVRARSGVGEKGDGQAEALSEELGCGLALRGRCEASKGERAKAWLCLEDAGGRAAIRNGTVFKTMAVRRFLKLKEVGGFGIWLAQLALLSEPRKYIPRCSAQYLD